MLSNVCGLVIKVDDKIKNLSSKVILGRSLLDWVALSLAESYHAAIEYNPNTEIVNLVRPYVDKHKEYCVVLFSDTPLITKRTVLDALATLKSKGLNVLKMTRGYVFKTSFLLEVEKLYAPTPYYFEEEDFLTALSYKQVALITEYLKNRINAFHMQEGVYIVDPSSTYIDCDVTIGQNVTIMPNNILQGNTQIKDGVVLKSGNVIDSCIIDENAVVNHSQLNSSYIGKNTTVGPYAYIRPDSVIGDNCRIGDFVEIKKSVIGNKSKVSHLAYVGDAEIGTGCNIGCGVVFVNYDGKNKFKTKVGNNVFVGSNSNIIAPITLDDEAFVAAGSTLTASVPQGNLAIARERQVNKPNWKRPL